MRVLKVGCARRLQRSGQARPPYGVKNSREALPRVRLGRRCLEPLFGCYCLVFWVRSKDDGKVDWWDAFGFCVILSAVLRKDYGGDR